MRLKFGRLINISLRDGNGVNVPNGELWKYTATLESATRLEYDGFRITEPIINGYAANGTRLRADNGSVKIQGIAFKVVKE